MVLPPVGQVSQPQHDWHFGWGDSLLWGTVLCLAAYLVPTH